MLRQRKLRLVLVALVLCVTGILLTVGFQVHYAAPCASVFILLLIEAFRRVRLWSRAAGTVLVLAAPVAWIAIQALGTKSTHIPSQLEKRPAVLAKVASKAGRHLVLVRYSPDHPLGQEWVYNEPDLDDAKVIWARDLGSKSNRALLQYYPSRHLWLVEPDYSPVRLFRLRSSMDLTAEQAGF
jgi:hypothetical protein